MKLKKLQIKMLNDEQISIEEIKEALQEYLKDMEEWELDIIVQSYIDEYSYYGYYVASMDTFNEYFRYDSDILSIINNLYKFNINDRYFYVTDLNYIKSCDYLWDYVCDELDCDSFIDHVYSNLYSLDLDEFEELKEYIEEFIHD